jgi:antitoxin (DNA-binding transcriptional repressor) of toxin-antitoxin stability system
MTEISALEFRRDMEAFIRKVRQGQSFLLTYRGEPVLRLEPIERNSDEGEKSLDALLSLSKKWDSTADSESLDHNDIDRIVYGL